ncbi:MAG: DUF1883 domain-containing protein [Chloroflexota bacterium]|nr:DUF1883 domain-containing protein [Chloroflexota bacterium]MDE2951660.1 DUF1883 domain-containing protein [Chloroflexota bacterium]
MQFIKHDLGQLSGGEIAEVSITSAANVRLLDSNNFLKYRSGQRHKYTGGHYTQSPVQFEIPRPGRWYVVVDLGGYAGEVGSSIRVLSKEILSN